MSKFLSRLLFNTIAALIAAYLLSGVHIDGVATALLVAIVLALLNTFIKPLLILVTIPLTIVTFGLFLIVINVLIIKWTASIVNGFSVDNWFWALLFSIIISVVSSILEGLLATDDK